MADLFADIENYSGVLADTETSHAAFRSILSGLNSRVYRRQKMAAYFSHCYANWFLCSGTVDDYFDSRGVRYPMETGDVVYDHLTTENTDAQLLFRILSRKTYLPTEFIRRVCIARAHIFVQNSFNSQINGHLSSDATVFDLVSAYEDFMPCTDSGYDYLVDLVLEKLRNVNPESTEQSALDAISQAQEKREEQNFIYSLRKTEDEKIIEPTPFVDLHAHVGVASYEMLEELVCLSMIRRGYKAELTKKSGDQGADVLAYKQGTKWALQMKHYANPVGNSAVQEVISALHFYRCSEAAVIATNLFTKSAQELASVSPCPLSLVTVKDDLSDVDEKVFEMLQGKFVVRL